MTEASRLVAECKRLAKQVSSAGFNAGVEDAGDAWTRQEKTAIAMNQRLIELSAAIDALAALIPPTAKELHVQDR